MRRLVLLLLLTPVAVACGPSTAGSKTPSSKTTNSAHVRPKASCASGLSTFEAQIPSGADVCGTGAHVGLQTFKLDCATPVIGNQFPNGEIIEPVDFTTLQRSEQSYDVSLTATGACEFDIRFPQGALLGPAIASLRSTYVAVMDFQIIGLPNAQVGIANLAAPAGNVADSDQAEIDRHDFTTNVIRSNVQSTGIKEPLPTAVLEGGSLPSKAPERLVALQKDGVLRVWLDGYVVGQLQSSGVGPYFSVLGLDSTVTSEIDVSSAIVYALQ